MYRLKAIPKARIWGTERLQEYLSVQTNQKIGSIYSASGIKEIDNFVDATENQTLGELVAKDPAQFGLRKGEEFPLIISMTAADEDLSIQVHPTDHFAREIENKSYGKSEAWFFISPPLSGSIIAGQTVKSISGFRAAVTQGSYEKILGRETVSKEEMVYIPAGTIHALTKGSLVYEIQQATDITYRFYDYDRLDLDGNKRELHTEKALETTNFQQTVSKKTFPLEQTLDVREFKVKRTILQEQYRNDEEVAQVITLLAKNTTINCKEVTKGQSLIILPKEQITIKMPVECMIATPKLYWRDEI